MTRLAPYVNQIALGNFRLEDRGETVRAVCSVTSPGSPDELWFEVPARQAAALDVDEPNWALAAMLYPAMAFGRSLVVDAALSPRLLFFARDDLQSLLASQDPRLSKIAVHAEPNSRENQKRPHRVATGFSAGIDSFASASLYSRPDVPPAYRLTDLTVFGTGTLAKGGEAAVLFERYCKRCLDFAERRGYSAFCVRSNLDDFFSALPFRSRFNQSHTLRNAAAALLLQNTLTAYIYSSGYPYGRIGPRRSEDMATIDPILLPLLSTEGLTFISGGAARSRVEKIELVADDPDAAKMLDVCVAPHSSRLAGDKPNCSRCWKCARTMMTLEALGRLDDFSDVFDIQMYQELRAKLLVKIWRRAVRQGDSISREAIEFARSRNVPLPLRMRIFP